MSWIIYCYLAILLLFCLYLVIVILRILPLIIYVHQPLPFVPIPNRAAKELAQLPQLQSANTIVDLGCGTGTLLSALHRYHPTAQLTGVEHKASLLRWAKWRVIFWKKQPTFICGDMFKYDLSQVDAVVGFWIPKLIPKITEHFLQQARPSAVLVSYLFPIKSSALIETTKQVGKHKIFIYRKKV